MPSSSHFTDPPVAAATGVRICGGRDEARHLPGVGAAGGGNGVELAVGQAVQARLGDGDTSPVHGRATPRTVPPSRFLRMAASPSPDRPCPPWCGARSSAGCPAGWPTAPLLQGRAPSSASGQCGAAARSAVRRLRSPATTASPDPTASGPRGPRRHARAPAAACRRSPDMITSPAALLVSTRRNQRPQLGVSPPLCGRLRVTGCLRPASVSCGVKAPSMHLCPTAARQ